MPGVDVAQVGINQSNTVTRGFNNVFSGSLLVLTDPTNGDLIQTGVVAESTSGGVGALREPDVAHIVTRLMRVQLRLRYRNQMHDRDEALENKFHFPT